MQAHHAVRTLRLWVLAWFVLALGAATASPLLKPRPLEFVCAGGGSVQLFVHTAGDGLVPASAAGLDCPLCLAADAPPAAPAPPPGLRGTGRLRARHRAAPARVRRGTDQPARAGAPFFLSTQPILKKEKP